MYDFQGCQLAEHWQGWPEQVDYVSVEPKLDGYRLTAVVQPDDSVSFFCREPEPPKWIEHLDHIAREVQELGLEPGYMLDGEIMAADWNETSKLLRTYRDNMTHAEAQRVSDEVKFYVFDAVDLNNLVRKPPVGRQRKPRLTYDVPQCERRGFLEGRINPEPGWAVQLVPSLRAYSQEQVDQHYAWCCERYEGAIVKLPHAPYGFIRNDHWQKIKPLETLELVLTAAVEGEGKHVGRLGALVGLDPKGQEVRVGTGFSDAERERLWALRATLPGLRVEISKQAGKVATARHPVYLRLRDVG